VGIELGVARGAFSRLLLERSRLKMLHLVDKWDDHHDISEMGSVKKNLKGKEHRYIIHHCTFNEAIDRIDDHSVGFIYIDGYAHTGQADVDFSRWIRKLKPGGILAGHDYHSKFMRTVKKIQRIAKRYKKEIYTTDEEIYPSWYMFF
jgi:hypothetical protein